MGLEFLFAPDRTCVRRVDIADVEDLASGLSTHQRVAALLRHGALTKDEVAAKLGDIKPATLRVALHRGLKRAQFVELPSERIGLPERGQA